MYTWTHTAQMQIVQGTTVGLDFNQNFYENYDALFCIVLCQGLERLQIWVTSGWLVGGGLPGTGAEWVLSREGPQGSQKFHVEFCPSKNQPLYSPVVQGSSTNLENCVLNSIWVQRRPSLVGTSRVLVGRKTTGSL